MTRKKNAASDDKLRPRMKRQPEILAPAGDMASLRVALQDGADAIYFGLDEGFNARMRAQNFSLDNLVETVGLVHRAGARAYLAMNTLVFEPELTVVERLVRAAAKAGVDALIVQDPAVALLARRICPDLHLHASTQMTVSSPEAARFAATLGVQRVVVPRELSVTEIRRFAEGTDLQLEVFIMGALCVSWSGQCLSSEAWGGRSANRGQCAQACRLPYELVVDGQTRPLGDVAYLLSPKDLAGFRAVGELMEIGVHTLKIEGRQKGPGYVHAATASMRRWVDALARGADDGDVRQMQSDVRDLSLAYSRGFSDGWLAGSDHQTLVEGRFPKHRGIYLGRVTAIDGLSVQVTHDAPSASREEGTVSSPLPPLGGSPVAATGPALAPLTPAAGMGVVFDEGRPQETEQGGPIFAARAERGRWILTFGRPGPDLRRVSLGARVWVSSDPSLQSEAQKAARSPDPSGRLPLEVHVVGRCGEPLHVIARFGGTEVSVRSEEVLTHARRAGLDEGMLRDKLCAFGGTPYKLKGLDAAELDGGTFIPVSTLKNLRRALVRAVSMRFAEDSNRPVDESPQVGPMLAEARARCESGRSLQQHHTPPRLIPTCRTAEQLEAVIECGLDEVYLDWMELVGLRSAVERARTAGLKVGVATVRVQKPGEEGYDRRLEALQPDAVLVRHWAGLMHFAARAKASRPEVHGDFSLNVTNAITGYHLLSLGLDSVTAAHDLDERQLFALIDDLTPQRLAVTVHHHIPTFHTEHCVYSNTLSHGRDFRTCGRPCETHLLALRDRAGSEHPVIVDVGCRNTVFNALAQSAASLVPRLVSGGVRMLRIEFVRETREQARSVLECYGALLGGRMDAADVVRRVGVHEQFGVTRGTMQVLR